MKKTSSVSPGGLAIYGNGADGFVTIAGDTDLTRDMFYFNLTINAGVTLSTKGYSIFVKETAYFPHGTIENKGNDGVGQNNPGAALAAGSIGGSSKGGKGSSWSASGTGKGGSGGGGGGVVFICAKNLVYPDGIISVKGGDGANGSVVSGTVSREAEVGDNASHALGSSGGAGGNGTEINGAGPGVAVPPFGGFKALPFSIILKEIETTLYKISGGCGGGGGGSGSTDGGGGGGGGGGLIVLVYNEATHGTTSYVHGCGGAGAGGADAGSDGVDGTLISILNR